MAAKGITAPWQEHSLVISPFLRCWTWALQLQLVQLEEPLWNVCQALHIHTACARLQCRGTVTKAPNKAFCTKPTSTCGWHLSHHCQPRSPFLMCSARTVLANRPIIVQLRFYHKKLENLPPNTKLLVMLWMNFYFTKNTNPEKPGGVNIILYISNVQACYMVSYEQAFFSELLWPELTFDCNVSFCPMTSYTCME